MRSLSLARCWPGAKSILAGLGGWAAASCKPAPLPRALHRLNSAGAAGTQTSRPSCSQERAPLAAGMYVVKRDGRQEPVHFDKITARISRLAYGLNPDFCDPVRPPARRAASLPPDRC